MTRKSHNQGTHKEEIKIKKQTVRLQGMRLRSNWLTHKMLVKAVALETNYHVYEVDDILRGLYPVLHDAFLKGKSWDIPEVGSFVFKLNKPRWFKRMDGKIKKSDWSRTLTFSVNYPFQCKVKEYFRQRVLPSVAFLEDITCNTKLAEEAGLIVTHQDDNQDQKLINPTS